MLNRYHTIFIGLITIIVVVIISVVSQPAHHHCRPLKESAQDLLLKDRLIGFIG
jgi:hypothetical protein